LARAAIGSRAVNVWNLHIAFIGSPPSDENWDRAEKIVEELRQRDQRVGDQAGAFWTFDYGMTEATAEQAIADIEGKLTEIDGDALTLLRVGLAG
jgi:hypothetical protein